MQTATQLSRIIKSFVLVLMLICPTWINAQNFEIGNWREHLPYIHTKKTVEGDGKIYCATDDGFYSYDLSEKTIE